MNAWKSYHKGGNKYNARKVMVDGQQFDSVKEGRRFQSLRLMEKAGMIEDLRRQVTFTLIPPQDIRDRKTGKHLRTERAIKYVADFVYTDNRDGRTIVEDVKGYRGGQAYAIFSIKRKLMLYLFGIEVIEI